jgi:tRNA 2-thiouridine synthesizing protein A
MGEISQKTPDQTLDVMGRVCPYPLVLAKKAIEKLDSGQVLKILCDAPASAEDSLPRWAEKQGHKFEAVKLEDKEETWDLFIEKK